jgi:nitroreductase
MVPATQVDETFARLAARYSIGPKHLIEPAPDADALLAAARLALRAPDHKGLRPYRFLYIPPAQRAALAERFAQGARERGRSDEDVARARERAVNGPALVALLGRVRDDIEDVPAREQWLSIGAALMNFLNGLHLQGFGAKVLSGASVEDAVVQRALCGTGETLLCWIVAGTPARLPHARFADDPLAVLSTWAPVAPQARDGA